jgi:hypothetical protein
MNPLRHQIQQLAQAPGVATNPFEKILAGFGIVRDDVRHMAMSDYQHARRSEMYDARRKQERSEIDASAQKRADLQARNMQIAHDLEMERMGARHGQYKERHANDGNAQTENPAQDAGENPAVKKEKPAPDPLKQKRTANGVRPDGDAYIKDIEEGIRDFKRTGGELGIDPDGGAEGLSKAYDAREAKKAAHKAAVEAASAGKPTGKQPNNSNVNPGLAEAAETGPKAPVPNAVGESLNVGDIANSPDYAQGAGRKDYIK